MCVLCYLGLLLVPSGQELHNYNVGFGHFQYTSHLLKSINNWLLISEDVREGKSFLGWCNTAETVV